MILKDLEDAINSGDFATAQEKLKPLLSENPKSALFWYLSGEALAALGQVKGAEDALKTSLSINPKILGAWIALGNIYRIADNNACAIAAYEQAIGLECKNSLVFLRLGKLYLKESGIYNIEKAIKCYEAALKIKPDYTDGLLAMADIQEKINNLDKANFFALEALKLEESDKTNFMMGSILLRQGRYEAALDMFLKIETPNPDKELQFALGRVHDALGNYNKAYAHFSNGNAQIKSSFDKNKYLGYLHKESLLLQKNLEDFDGDDQQSPIFLVGFPRSGTTLLEQVLDSHPMVQSMDEKGILAEVQSSLGKYPIPDLRGKYENQVDKYLMWDKSKVLIDKFPLNMCRLRTIKTIYPAAKIIFSLRHPCDVVLSNFQQNFKMNDAMANTTTLIDTVHYYDQVMNLWLKSCEVLKPNIYTIRYESLVDDLEVESRKLLEFLRLEWDANMAKFYEHAQKRNISTPSYSQVTQPIYKTSAGKWRNYEKYLAPHMPVLDKWIKHFGY